MISGVIELNGPLVQAGVLSSLPAPSCGGFVFLGNFTADHLIDSESGTRINRATTRVLTTAKNLLVI